eukprot:212957_1
MDESIIPANPESRYEPLLGYDQSSPSFSSQDTGEILSSSEESETLLTFQKPKDRSGSGSAIVYGRFATRLRRDSDLRRQQRSRKLSLTHSTDDVRRIKKRLRKRERLLADHSARVSWRNNVTLLVGKVVRRSFLLLLLLGVTCASLTFSIALLVGAAWDLQLMILDADLSGWATFFATTGLRLAFILGAVAFTDFVGPEASGSGIPELRAILSGIFIRGYLSLRTLFAKIVGLVLAVSSGLPVGLEGPSVHISAAIGHLLQRVPFFRNLDKTQVLSAACAGGIASCFGAPIGAVLFSIEVTSSFYRVSNYWASFCCSITAASMAYIFEVLHPTSLLLFHAEFVSDRETFELWEIPVFCCLGVAGGLLGSFIVKIHSSFVKFRRRYQARFLGSNPYIIAAVVTILFSLITFPLGAYMIRPYRVVVHDMFTAFPSLSDSTQSDNRCTRERAGNLHCFVYDWTDSPRIKAAAFIVVHSIFLIPAVTLNFPCGIFAPVFAMGAVFGRIFGETVNIFYAREKISLVAASYAVIGASSLTAGVTRTVSAAVIALEITQQSELLFPCVLGAVCACGVSAHFGHSIYDSILRLKGLPLLPATPSGLLESEGRKQPTALHVMEIEVPMVTVSPTKEDIDELLGEHFLTHFPVVQSTSHPILVGEVNRSTLAEFRNYLDTVEADPESEGTGLNPRTEHSLFMSRFADGLHHNPFQVSSTMPLTKLYTMFHILRPHVAYVTHLSMLIGVITEEMLIRRETEASRI